MKRLTLIFSDIAVLYGSLIVVLTLRYPAHDWSYQYQLHLVPFSILFVVWLFSFYIANLYQERTLRNGRDFLERIAQATGLAAVLSIAFFYLIPYFTITPKLNLFLFIVTCALLLSGVRYTFNRIIAVGSKKRVLIVGVNQESLDLASFVTDNPQLGYTVRALAHIGQEQLPMDQVSRWPVLGQEVDIGDFIRGKHIDTVVISPQAYQSSNLVGILYRTLATKVTFIDLADFSEELTGTVPLGAISQIWFLSNLNEGSKKSFQTIKRSIDVAAAIFLGLFTAALTPFIALAIALDSRGPIFFRQTRTGQAGLPFEIVKFRTMRMDAEKHTGAVWASENDPRVTRVGRFLRLTRIDELPQLWNIFMGHMSLVGPRAERPEIDERLAKEISFYRERYLVKPGLSGWAQINYPYGASTQDAINKLEYDLYYIKHRTVMMDLEIILKTISISLRRAGR